MNASAIKNPNRSHARVLLHLSRKCKLPATSNKRQTVKRSTCHERFNKPITINKAQQGNSRQTRKFASIKKMSTPGVSSILSRLGQSVKHTFRAYPRRLIIPRLSNETSSRNVSVVWVQSMALISLKKRIISLLEICRALLSMHCYTALMKPELCY